MPICYPPFHLDASAETLAAFGEKLTGFALVKSPYQPDPTVPRADSVWFRDVKGGIWIVGVGQRGLMFKFEVFNLSVESLSEMTLRIETEARVGPPPDAPEWFRALAAAPRTIPSPPESFEPLPFAIAGIQVLRRAELVIGDADVGTTFGGGPMMQSAAKPAEILADAQAYCVVSVGLLLTGADGRRLLMGADWSPMKMVVTDRQDFIDAYMTVCDAQPIAAYVAEITERHRD